MAEMAETNPGSKYPLLIFIVGVPGSFAHDIGQRIAYEYGFFFMGISQRFNVPKDEQRDTFLVDNNGSHSNSNNSGRHSALSYLGPWQLDQNVGTFLRETKHLQNRPCLVIEGYPRHTRHIPDFWKEAQRLFVYCDCPKQEAERRAVGGPLDWDPDAPADGKAREETGWNKSPRGRDYWDAKHRFDLDWWYFDRRAASLLGHYVSSDTKGGSESWRTVYRYVLRERFTAGKVVLVGTGEGEFEECWGRAKEALENSVEFRTMLSEIGDDFETMADDDDDDDDNNHDDGCGHDEDDAEEGGD